MRDPREDDNALRLNAEMSGDKMHPSGSYFSEMKVSPDRSHKPCKKPGRKPKALRHG